MMLLLSLGLVIAIHTSTPVLAATITSNKTGNWNTGSTWVGGVIPGATDKVIIAAGHTVTIPQDTTATCGDLNVTGTLSLNGPSDHPANIHVYGNGTSPVTTGAISGTGTIANSAGSSGGANVEFYGDWSFNGTMSGYVSFYFEGSQDQNTAGGKVTFPRNLFIAKSGGTVYFPVTPTFTNGYFHITSAGGGTTDAGTVCYNGGAQSVAVPASGYDYYNLTLAGSGQKTIGSLTVDGTLSMEGTATASAAPTYGSSATLRYNTATSRNAGPEWITPFAATGGVIIDNTGTITLNEAKVFNINIPLTINSGATLATNNFQLTFGGNFVNNGGTFTAGSSPIVIANTMATQSIAGFTATGTVSMTKTGGTATFMGNVNGGGLTINGVGGTLGLGSGLTHNFTGTWTRTAGTLAGNSSTLNLGGSLSGTGGTFTAGTGTVNYYGAAQTIAAVTYNNLIINQSSGSASLGGSITVNGVLTLTNGGITTGSNKVIIAAGGSVSRTSGHIIGNLQKNVATGSVSRTFEVGTASGYDPIVVNFGSVSVAGNLTANVTAGEHPSIGTSAINSSKNVNVYWSFTNSGITFTSYNATFNFIAGDIDGGANTTNFIVGKYDAGWTYPTVGTKTSTSTQVTGVTSLSDFVLGEAAAPTVTAISPNAGPTAGGTSVNITGTRFLSGATVTIGGAAATGVTVVNSTRITATTPAGTAGAQDVTVTTVGGSGTLAGGYTYIEAPTVTTISPSSGPEAGGTSVNITGTNFISVATVTIGGAAATGVTVVNSTMITATTPAGTPGAQDVVVTAAGGAGTLTGGYFYVPLVTFTTNSTFTVPAGVYQITVEAWGGGGGGGGRSGSSPNGGAGGGGGGAYARATINVTPGETYNVIVGGGGAGHSGDTAGSAGGDSYFYKAGGANLTLTKGGAGGAGGASGTYGAGGSAGACVGDFKYSGGRGAAGTSSASGGGGGGAGNQTAGGNATGTTGGTGGNYDGGDGADGRTNSGTGSDGSVRGGGGSGACRLSGGGGPFAGGSGARGEVRITYKPAPDAPALYPENDVQIAFNNIRQNTTTPTFRVSATHTGNFTSFQLELNTAPDFTGTTYRQTFSGNYSSGTQYNLNATGLSPSLPATDGVTYYVRVRASADGGAHWSEWSTVNHPVWTFTYKSAAGFPDWFQTTDAQFGTGTLANTTTTGSGSVRLGGITATGGTITEVGGYRIHTFTSGGTFTVTAGSGDVEYLIVAGGGGGGGISTGNVGGGGGGGAGGVRTGSVSVSTGGYPVTMGAGGTAGTSGTKGGTGGSSSFAGVTATGGGGGASSGAADNNGVSGGSGGGGRTSGSGGTGTLGQGSDGGDGDSSGGAGGGGGATAAGASSSGTSGGNGGNGLTSTINGTSVTYGGGGGGGGYGGSAGGTGGTGGGGSAPNSRGAGTNGTANRGGGGSGASGSSSGSAYSGGAGGSGIVIIRYPIVTTGTITSPAINFTWVPGASNWGAVQVGATTATNNSITVQVLNAVGSPISGKNVTIQNGGTSGSINLTDVPPTGNNATLYLRATLTNSGGGTPYLNDWMLTWVAAAPVPSTITVTAPSAIAFATLVWGDNINSSATNGTVTVTLGGSATGWQVTAKNVTGYMKAGNTTLANKLQISGNGTGWANADVGITYNGTAAGNYTLPFWVKQAINTNEVVGAYSIIITFTGEILY
jgi:hypothetical protein